MVSLEPDRSLATQRLAGRKKNKERITIALCSNADGSHKIDPLVIGKYRKPRCFKNININSMSITYRYNGKAWMTTTIFQEWLEMFDRLVGRKHDSQRVLLLLDNCSSHKRQSQALRHVDVHFLPPNTTSKIQPMDAGIIMAFKKHYRRPHIRWILEQVEAGHAAQDLKMDILQAIYFIIKAWDEITPDTIHNCFRHTGILPIHSEEDVHNLADNAHSVSDPVLDGLANDLEALNFPDCTPLEEFLNNPEEDVVDEVLDEDEIMAAIIDMYKNPEIDTGDAEEEDDSTELPVVSNKHATEYLEGLRIFFLQQENSNEYIKMVGKMDRFIRERRSYSMQQSRLERYFDV
jgi:hypothetical protein